ncbi:hypothetical protein [Pseudomonas viridiflava]|uniref:hypothetical protein n=1 Tax=Pseudomonas viridiflava TaxID=33069 RepID=UPI0013CFDD7D|nr:hypothetical protein [Pseudomonas viridiflava]
MRVAHQQKGSGTGALARSVHPDYRLNRLFLNRLDKALAPTKRHKGIKATILMSISERKPFASFDLNASVWADLVISAWRHFFERRPRKLMA